jgi:hypothetical protein
LRGKNNYQIHGGMTFKTGMQDMTLKLKNMCRYHATVTVCGVGASKNPEELIIAL